MRLLNSCPATQPEKFSECGENMVVYYNNNLGCMNVYLGKPSLAQMYFNKAFQELSEQYGKLRNPSDQGTVLQFCDYSTILKACYLSL